jgi:uncharacterized protein (TIGR00369 family)
MLDTHCLYVNGETIVPEAADTTETSTPKGPPADGLAIMRQFIPNSPFARRVGIEIETLEPGRALLTLPFRPGNSTMGEVIHGGAITALVDTAAMAAAWSSGDVPEELRGSTVDLSVSFVAAARGEDLSAEARVLRRGRSLCYCEVDVTGDQGRLVAKALVTYKLG